MLLKDRVAIITGAGSGIGQGVALRFAREGARLALVDIRPEALEDTAAQLHDTGADFETYTGDVALSEDVERFFAASVERFARIDIAVNNAGIGNPVLPLHMMTNEGFDRRSR
jgi:NAD(P)-dependent dehydrogenase (short-subunit alcohol dehydrogenase family)